MNEAPPSVPSGPNANGAPSAKHKRVHVIVTAEPSNSSVNAAGGEEAAANHVQAGGSTRRMRFEVRPLTDDQLAAVGGGAATHLPAGATANHCEMSEVVCSVQPGSSTVTSRPLPPTTSANSQLHQPLCVAAARSAVSTTAVPLSKAPAPSFTSTATIVSRQPSARFSPKASPTSLHSLHSGYGSSTALLTTTTSGANHLRSGDAPSRNPSVKSTGYADVATAGASAGASARIRSLRRRISHTLLYVPEQRRVSTTSGVSVTSCPTEFAEDDDRPAVTIASSTPASSAQCSTNPTKRRYTPAANAKDASARVPLIQPTAQDTQSLCAIHPAVSAASSNASSVSSRRQSIQAGAPRPTRPGNPNVAVGPAGGISLNKRVSWMSMKSLQDPLDELAEFRQRVYGGGGSCAPRSDSRTNSQLDIVMNDTFDIESDTPPIDTMSWSNLDEFEASCTLMYSKHEKIPMKDFGSEIRATMDIDHLLNKAETSLEEIFAKIIHEMDIQEPEFTKRANHILSRTVQSICTTGTVGGTFDYDQTWICALCMLNTVQHRHVAIARLSHPTNLGRTMQDLRFIIIVIAPSRAKGTKTALETTRTFATLFADMDIRQKLVMAQSVEVFRATLLDAAKELAFEQSQWRERKASIHLSEAKEQVSLNYDFYAMYACVGLSCQFFLIIYACTELCSFMKLATRSAEEMFSLFIAIAFTVESIRAIHLSFVNNYNNCDELLNATTPLVQNFTKADMFKMRQEISLFTIPPIFSLPTEAYFICFLLGFFLSFLFYMDQNITSAIYLDALDGRH
ncbi:Bicarbonate transporter domain containing protein [Aphelenchoides fujianensis]|nr:Bicarbonate transporter domain containing protein [Aphelenchoides fujianensis]